MVFHALVKIFWLARASRITFIGSSPSSTRLICSRSRCRSIVIPVSVVPRFSSACTAIGALALLRLEIVGLALAMLVFPH